MLFYLLLLRCLSLRSLTRNLDWKIFAPERGKLKREVPVGWRNNGKFTSLGHVLFGNSKNFERVNYNVEDLQLLSASLGVFCINVDFLPVKHDVMDALGN